MPTKAKVLPLLATAQATTENANQQPVPPLVLIRLPEVLRRTALSKTHIYDLMKAGNFPASISLGCKSVAWVESMVQDWIQAKIVAARGV